MKVTCFAGLIGTGKTRAACQLEQATGAERISRDELRARLFDPPDYSVREKQLVFEIMLMLARRRLQQGRDVILEGMPFSRRAERDAARRLAETVNADFEMLHCVCQDEVALERIAAQEHPGLDRDKDLYFKVKAAFEPFGEDEEVTKLHTS